MPRAHHAWRWFRSPLFVDDQAGAALQCEIRPGPLEKDEDSVLKSDQIINVDEEPREPGQEPAHFNTLKLQNGFFSSDRGHLTFVDIMKCPAWPSIHIIEDVLSDLAALLNRDWC